MAIFSSSSLSDRSDDVGDLRGETPRRGGEHRGEGETPRRGGEHRGEPPALGGDSAGEWRDTCPPPVPSVSVRLLFGLGPRVWKNDVIMLNYFHLHHHERF